MFIGLSQPHPEGLSCVVYSRLEIGAIFRVIIGSGLIMAGVANVCGVADENVVCLGSSGGTPIRFKLTPVIVHSMAIVSGCHAERGFINAIVAEAFHRRVLTSISSDLGGRTAHMDGLVILLIIPALVIGVVIHPLEDGVCVNALIHLVGTLINTVWWFRDFIVVRVGRIAGR